ncbi:MAG: hypothetical protein AVDCRST_MAG20-143, partial [uncultured Acidimicrobiales bacterium]
AGRGHAGTLPPCLRRIGYPDRPLGGDGGARDRRRITHPPRSRAGSWGARRLGGGARPVPPPGSLGARLGRRTM